MDQSVCHSTLKFSFKTQEQATKFIKLFLKHHVNHVPADNLFYEVVTEFDERGLPYDVYIITIDDIHWANNLIKIAKLIKKCDFKE